jgi:hypothetical protein
VCTCVRWPPTQNLQLASRTLQQERETIAEREKIMEEMERDQESAKIRLEERKLETRQIVEAEIRR